MPYQWGWCPVCGGAVGNRQVRAHGPHTLTHGFYASTLHPDALAGLDEGAIDTSLDGEILIVRSALRRLQLMIVTGTTPGPRASVSTTMPASSGSPSRAPTPCRACSASATTSPATTGGSRS